MACTKGINAKWEIKGARLSGKGKEKIKRQRQQGEGRVGRQAGRHLAAVLGMALACSRMSSLSSNSWRSLSSS